MPATCSTTEPHPAQVWLQNAAPGGTGLHWLKWLAKATRPHQEQGHGGAGRACSWALHVPCPWGVPLRVKDSVCVCEASPTFSPVLLALEGLDPTFEKFFNEV